MRLVCAATIGILFTLFFGGQTSYAQLISYRKETIYAGDKPYAFLVKSGSSWAKEYTLQNLEHIELATIKPVFKQLASDFDFVYYEVRFKGFPVKAEMQDDDDFDRILAYEFGKFKILRNDSLNPASVALFLEKYPAGKFSQSFSLKAKPLDKPIQKELKKAGNTNRKTAGKNEAKPAKLPDLPAMDSVNKTAAKPAVIVPPLMPIDSNQQGIVPEKKKNSLVIDGPDLIKGEKTIGRFTVSEKTVGGKLKKSITFYNSKKQKIAVATFADAGSLNCQLSTLKDKKTKTVSVSSTQSAVAEIAARLLQDRYL